MRSCELLIVGAGAAGLSAARSAWDAGCRDILLTDRASRLGGVLPQCLHEGFGLTALGAELSGPAYASHLAEELAQTGVRMLLGRELLSVTKEKTALLSGGGSLERIRFERLILATGCRERTIGELPLGGTRPAGIFTAGQAQEMLNLRHWELGEEIVILGSGDLGMIMARRFTLEGKHVVAVLEQNSSYGGMARNYRRCIEAFRIPLRYGTSVRALHGTGRLCGVTIVHLAGGGEEFLPCDTLVTALGLIPEREPVRGLDEPDWLYLAGNCHRVHDLVDSAAAEAEKVGRAAALSLKENGADRNQNEIGGLA